MAPRHQEARLGNTRRMLSGVALLMSVAVTVQSAVLVSPEVHKDRTITFRMRASKAESVAVSIEGRSGLALKKGEDGVWSVTTPALEPDIYGYNLVVDGVPALDPLNGDQKPNLIWPGNLVTVPGNQIWEVRNVAHGTVHRHYYHSKAIGDDRDFFIYTPPAYSGGRDKLPVLYLFHGYSDTAIGWTEVGKANVILDNLIAEKRIKPMIVVMPLGYGVEGFASRSRGFPSRPLLQESFTKFRQSLIEEVIPVVEKEYRASPKREDRAIAGLSMGGGQALWIGLNAPQLFAHIGAFSTGGMQSAAADEDFSGIRKEDVNSLKTFFMACGTEDSLILYQRNLVKWLEARGMKVRAKETAGGHVWMLWRRNLAEFAEMISK